jgi:catechol 2,3-dioxygenase-like lactoylglutathione lyase family enzyme
MGSRFTELIVDCREPRALAEFWCAVLGYRVIDEPGEYVEIAGWEPSAEVIREGFTPPTLVFLTVPEPKAVKNRLHIDVSPIDRSQEEEVERIIGLGARRIDIGQGQQPWIVLADPEGNEFCVLRTLRP